MAPQRKYHKRIHIDWKKAVRRTLNFPGKTRSKLINLFAANGSFQEQHELRWGSLCASMMQSDSVGAIYGTKSISHLENCNDGVLV